MTVASLWKVLDKARCGKAVGANEIAQWIPFDNGQRLQPPRSLASRYVGQIKASDTPNKRRMALAIDLSIWICEALTSHAIKENHSNPHLHLVFSRTIKLLSLGTKLVCVIEGKRRIRGDHGEDDKFHKRRRGTAFWKACSECQQLLELLGVPVVRAKAEGEALCALLNMRGIVDGVISNDGDCLLFGATTVYTNFSLENLENGKVMRYDSKDLHASIDSTDNGNDAVSNKLTLPLSRNDLITFAILTGSDMVGCGMDNVGSVKALRFLRKCQLDFPLSAETAAMNELLSWSRVAVCGGKYKQSKANKTEERCCSRCSHNGTRLNHNKHGCEECGTSAGEPCLELSADDKFRDLLRRKALELDPPFDPTRAIHNYLRPNDNQLPLSLMKVTSETLEMSPPRLRDLASWRIIIKGRALEASRNFVIDNVARLLSRRELFLVSVPLSSNGYRRARELPVPQRIHKMIVRNQVPCYEVAWKVSSTVTDAEGVDIDGFEYLSIEQRALFDARFRDVLPRLFSNYTEDKKERTKQGDAEQRRRQKFLQSIFGGQEDGDEKSDAPKKALTRTSKKRQGFFQSVRPDPHALARLHRKRLRRHTSTIQISDDVARLMGWPIGSFCAMKKEASSIPNEPPGKIDGSQLEISAKEVATSRRIQFEDDNDGSPFIRCANSREPAHLPIQESSAQNNPLYCRMGVLDIKITPLVSRRTHTT
ncbi:hypothetical protein MPSEU_000900800 [Mayamaea pseudoterrestris]|nr:hypothetical protein MPSEU_000900800 [Mayamaea pseudoterrestris]